MGLHDPLIEERPRPLAARAVRQSRCGPTDYTIEIEHPPPGRRHLHTRTLVVHYTPDLAADGEILGASGWPPCRAASLDEVLSYLTVMDDNGDGAPDLSEGESTDHLAELPLPRLPCCRTTPSPRTSWNLTGWGSSDDRSSRQLLSASQRPDLLSGAKRAAPSGPRADELHLEGVDAVKLVSEPVSPKPT